jgi:hypothetical protein
MQQIVKKFRLQAKRVFLTYANCDQALTYVLEGLKSKFKNQKILNHILYIDKSQKETANIKNVCVYLCFDKKIDIKNIAFFDLKRKISVPSSKKHKNNFLCKIFHFEIEPIKDGIKTWQDIATDAAKKKNICSAKTCANM